MIRLSVTVVFLVLLQYWQVATSCIPPPPFFYINKCPKYYEESGGSQPDNEHYLIQSSPVQFTIEPQDLVFFNGSDISLHCETNCVQLGLTITSCSIGFLYNGCSLDHIITPFSNALSERGVAGRRTLTIHNANSAAVGQYQCFTYSKTRGRLPLTDRIIGRLIHLQIAALEPFDEEIQRVNVSEGGTIELPCMKGIFPNPSNISWQRNEDRCDSVQCLENIEMLPSGALVLRNVTVDVSGDLFRCVIGWNDHHRTYNATYQITVNSMNSMDNNSVKAMLKTELPAVVALNTSVSDGSAIYYKSDLLVDLRNVDYYLINVTVICTFSGHPRPQVKWFLNGLNVSECIDTTNIVTVGNKSILYLSTTNPKSFFGSYQCVVDNEVGYASNTTRILPKGWSNPPEILSVKLQNDDVTLRWGPPDYTGGKTIAFYRVAIQNLLDGSDEVILEDKANISLLTYKNIRIFYGANGELYFRFKIQIVNNNAVPISDSAEIRIDSQPDKVQPEIREMDCTENSVTVTWINHNQNAYSNIWDHCVYYNCSTAGGDVTGELCTPELRRDGVFRSLYSREISNVPLNGICSFRVMVYSNGHAYKWSNYETCKRNLSSPVTTSKMMDQTHTKGDVVTFTCQTTSEPISNNISWYFNGAPLNESNKYHTSTQLLNYTTITNTLTIMSVESSDVGTYTCYVTNGRSTDMSSAVLSVKEVPVITGSEKEFNIIEGDSITCTATGYPVPDIVWLNSIDSVVDKDRLKTDNSMGVGNLSIVNVSMTIGRNDTGVYKCIANNSIGNDTRTINITVHSIPVINIKETEQVYNITEGDSITCTATGYPVPDIVWLNNDGSVVDENRIKTDSAMATGVGNLYNVSVSMTVGRNDAGVYICIANNSIGNNTRTINISFPVITMPKTRQVYNITEGDSITCTATGYPVPDIVWLNNDGSVVDENRIKTDSAMATGVDNLYNVSALMTIGRNDGGVYICIANNSIGNDAQTINITVNSFPIITTPETEQVYNITEGDSITCTATGYPVPDIVWLNNDGSVVDENRIKTDSTMATGVGNLFNVTVSMTVGRYDTGVYICIANNSIGNDTHAINITVNSFPIITTPETVQVYNISDGDSITCTATGYPVPDIVWLNNDGSVVDKNRLVPSIMTTGAGNTSSMSVSMIVRRGDSGVYTCQASNFLGNDSSTINITVQLLDEAVHSASNVPIWIGVFASVFLIVLLILLLLIVAVTCNRKMKFKTKPVINDQDILQVLNDEMDYDKLPRDDISTVEIISIKSSDLLGSRNSILDYENTDIIIDWLSQPKKPDAKTVSETEFINDDIFSFLDSEPDDMDVCSDCVLHDYYTSNKLRNSAATTDSDATSNSACTTTGSTAIDSGIDSHNKFPV